MLVATPGQTTAYSTLHNNTSNGGGTNGTAAATTASKKSSTVNSTNNTVSIGGKPSNVNSNHTVANKNVINSNTHGTTFNYRQNTKSDNIVTNKSNSQSKAAATSSREIISSAVAAATIHSLKNENSTKNTNTNTTAATATKQQSFIQTLKDSVQKALISTTGGNNGNNIITHKFSTNNNHKLQNNCNNSTTSINNVTSSLSSTTHNANKVTTTATSSNNSKTTTAAATQSSSAVSASAVRGKHFSCSLSKLHTVAPTVIHRYPEERQHAGSTDSLQKEMCHFKPIRIVPKTPWKSGSKSRGNCLRFPKANLATKISEFVLKSNCDVNNKKKKQQQNRTQNDKIKVNEDDVEINVEQENKEFHGIYKPKPSLTCVSTSFTTPNHQSAFVCLVAQMKSLISLRSYEQQLTSNKGSGSILELESDDESLREIYVYKKQKPTKKQQKIIEGQKQLLNVRGRPSTTYVATANTKQKNTKSHDIAKVSAVAITKAKSRRNLGRAKSKTVNMVTLATRKAKEKLHGSVSMPVVATNKIENITAALKNTRKRKAAQEDDIKRLDILATIPSTPSSTKTTSIKSFTQGARKSSRLSLRNTGATSTSSNNQPFNKTPRIISQQNSIQSPKKSAGKQSASTLRFSPPLTRSRLKHLAEQGKIVTSANTTSNIKKRKI